MMIKEVPGGGGRGGLITDTASIRIIILDFGWTTEWIIIIIILRLNTVCDKRLKIVQITMKWEHPW